MIALSTLAVLIVWAAFAFNPRKPNRRREVQHREMRQSEKGKRSRAGTYARADSRRRRRLVS
jgi:hypothetical protein